MKKLLTLMLVFAGLLAWAALWASACDCCSLPGSEASTTFSAIDALESLLPLESGWPVKKPYPKLDPTLPPLPCPCFPKPWPKMVPPDPWPWPPYLDQDPWPYWKPSKPWEPWCGNGKASRFE